MSGECAKGYQWFVCTIGPFRGCCASDPCSTGICPREDLPGGEPKPEVPSSGKPSPTPPTYGPLPSTGSPDPKTAVISSSNSPSASPISTFTTSTINDIPPTTTSSSDGETAVPAAADTAPGPSSTSSGGKIAMIGGIAGGLITLLLVALLAIFLIRRRRKRAAGHKSKQNPADGLANMYARTAEKKCPDTPSTSTDRSSFRHSKGFFKPFAGPSEFKRQFRTPSFPSDGSTMTSSTGFLPSSPAISRSSTSRGPRPDSGLNGLIPLDTVDENPASRRASQAPSSVKPLPSLPPALESTAELPGASEDGRSELPGSPSPAAADIASLRSPISAISIPRSQSPLAVRTPEGAMLQPNFDNRTETPGTTRTHAMSFMNYRHELE